MAKLRTGLAGDATLCAVVKADAYGHGAVAAARAALAGGATSLAVATAEEAAELRAGGIAAPVLVLGALGAEELPVALAAGAEVAAWTRGVRVRLRGVRRRRSRSRCTSSSTPAWGGSAPGT